ncbi:Glutathione S-transferase U22 [Camellia lanceoleosa]|uniref:Glutathione S-transferase U22 n=1 Tax=Camellia lanceoleosa TaxID=1840588 RepID=A0ACC0H3I8_9ERIC|nr:Glutathione S-transferase U22 [Camellia lanceoleosa]
MADQLILLGTWISPYSTRVKIALAEKGVDYEFVEEDLKNKSPSLLKTNLSTSKSSVDPQRQTGARVTHHCSRHRSSPESQISIVAFDPHH